MELQAVKIFSIDFPQLPRPYTIWSPTGNSCVFSALYIVTKAVKCSSVPKHWSLFYYRKAYNKIIIFNTLNGKLSLFFSLSPLFEARMHSLTHIIFSMGRILIQRNACCTIQYHIIQSYCILYTNKSNYSNLLSRD